MLCLCPVLVAGLWDCLLSAYLGPVLIVVDGGEGSVVFPFTVEAN